MLICNIFLISVCYCIYSATSTHNIHRITDHFQLKELQKSAAILDDVFTWWDRNKNANNSYSSLVYVTDYNFSKVFKIVCQFHYTYEIDFL